MTDKTKTDDAVCAACAGIGWVCETHTDKPWSEAGCQCDAGVPCQDCNFSLGRDDPPRMPPGVTVIKDFN